MKDGKDRRKHVRARSIFDLKVIDLDTLKVLGYLVDISSKGLGIIGQGPIRKGEAFWLELVVPLGEEVRERIVLRAKSVWCQKAPEGELYHTGFRLARISRSDRVALEQFLVDGFLLAR